ncbi:MAG: hypothetical protein AB1480_09755 [Nitrospirota bacterium]
MSQIVHILTVGTSLIENKGGEGRVSDNYKNVDELNNLCNNASNLARNGNDVSKLKCEIKNALLQLNPATEINNRPPRINKPTDRLPQEISYLWIKAHESAPETGDTEKKADCYLISSDSPLGKLSANVIKDYINGQNILKTHYDAKEPIVAKGVNIEYPKDFRESGFRNLIDKINETVKKALTNGAEKIYLNITGGFKGMVPYSTIAGMIHPSEKVILCYLFEDSKEIIDMPTYPIGLDFHHWHRNAARLKMVTEGGPTAGKYFLYNLSVPMQKLLYEDSGKKKLFSLGEVLKKQYEDQKNIDPLKVYSKEMVDKIMPDDLDNDIAKLKVILKNLIDRVGDLIWVGDKIPEMVEHAHRHHHNLLEFAEMFLTPIIGPEGVKKDFLNAKERFCLLAGILLHDCGHSLDFMLVDVEKIPLFPSEVREWHHYLSYQRLNNEEMANELKWPMSELNKLHHAVLTVCLYHRKKMKYTDNNEQIKVPIVNATFSPLEKYIEERNNDLPKSVDLMKVVALMRLIDSWDNQAKRAGSKEQVEHTLNILKRDHEVALKRAIESYELLIELDKNKNMAISEVKDDPGNIINIRLNDPDSSYHSECLKNGNSSEKKLARAWLTAAELADRADIKYKQTIHYMKHQCIKEVVVIPDNNFSNNNLSFKIVLIENEIFKYDMDDDKKYPELKEELKDIKDITDGAPCLPTLRKFIESKEVTPEYIDIKDYIKNKYNIKLNYCWKDDNGSERQYYPKPLS